MQVLKFGGTSVASAENIRKSLTIAAKAAEKSPVVMVVSALGGTTDILIGAGRAAAAADAGYRDTLAQLHERHRTAAQELLADAAQHEKLAAIAAQFGEIQTLCDGIFALGELSHRTLDRLMSYGELLSSRLIAAAAKAQGLPAGWADARQLIRTNSRFGAAEVDMAVTTKQVADMKDSTDHQIWVVPGFIGADANGTTTTLGRGGSDYTAALLAAALDADVLESGPM
jgi:aspartokinase/homoserine dehydrogenase 1